MLSYMQLLTLGSVYLSIILTFACLANTYTMEQSKQDITEQLRVKDLTQGPHHGNLLVLGPQLPNVRSTAHS